MPDELSIARERAAWWAFVLALGWSVIQVCLPGGNLGADLFILFANGIVAALYLPLLIGLRGGRRNTAMAIIAAALGLSHFVWAPLAAMVVAFLAAPISPFPPVAVENASMFAATGLVFGGLLCEAHTNDRDRHDAGDGSLRRACAGLSPD